jgi:hypothetical protein
MKPQCPEHGDTMKQRVQEIKTGYQQVLRKKMIIWSCQTDGCNKWCEQVLGAFIWP